MGVDQTSLDRIRNATFPTSRRGYDKQEVEKFLARLADWLETGIGDESRSDAVKRELERVGERTGAILAQAEESAEQIRTEASEQARSAVEEATETAESTRNEADSYSSGVRAEADAYAEETRSAVDAEASAVRSRIEREVGEALEDAEEQARRIVEEGMQRREDVEAVIADLVGRRDQVLAEVEELTARLEAAVREHRPEGADPFARPDDFDPDAEAEPDTEPHELAGEFDDDLEEPGEPDEELLGEDEAGDPTELLAEDAAVESPDVSDEVPDEQETAEHAARGGGPST